MSELEIKNLNELLNFDDTKKKYIINKLLDSHNDIFIDNENKIDISDDVYKDTGIDKWISKLPELDGSKELINKLIHNPISNLNKLVDRQQSILKDYDVISFKILKDYEDDILWIYKLNDEISKDNAINILFPSSFLISFINLYQPILDSYHLYKIFFIPLTSLIYPLTSILAPYFYIKKYVSNISITYYFSLIKNFIILFFKNTGNFKLNLFKSIFFFIYLFLYLYNIYQTFEFSALLYKTKQNLHKKMQGLINFVNESNYIISDFDNSNNILKPFIKNSYKPFDISIYNTMTNIYSVWKDNNIKNNISKLLLTIYTYDIINAISKLKDEFNYSLPVYDTSLSTKIWNMKNPILSDTQISNPISLEKNIIITGPNAAGKTTYVKSILSNIILAQTFGIIYGSNAIINQYDSIYSFMRISDELGTKSYFEAEAEYCLNMIKKASELSKQNKNALFLMDEPMHSTPPTEGLATAYAVIENIGLNNNINLIITTHFYKLTSLEETYPDNFINLHVEAIEKDDKFFFPYKIKKGSSYQCIAIELLSKKHFPISVINSAINIKKKIYKDIISI